MATFRKRSNGHWQARVRKTNQNVTKTFINKIDAERWAKQIEVEMQKGSSDLGNYCELFYKPLKPLGRPPSGYSQLNPIDPEQLAPAILKTKQSK